MKHIIHLYAVLFRFYDLFNPDAEKTVDSDCPHLSVLIRPVFLQCYLKCHLSGLIHVSGTSV